MLGTANVERNNTATSREASSRGEAPDKRAAVKDARDVQPENDEEPGHHAVRKSKIVKKPHSAGFPTVVGILMAIVIVLVSAGATIFFLTKSPDYERLYQQGQAELKNGQYAFAVKTLEQAVALRPQESKIYLALARAYVGVDQIEKAWQCVSQAQELGQSLTTEPQLASELANFYRQHQQWGRAAELLRPLAQAGVPGKKAELADLDGLWGDECIRNNDLNQAMKCWEEVRTIGEGTRVSEVDSRLATIYQRFANNLMASSDDSKALDYLTKLNVLAPTAATYEKVADIYERQGQLELAIDQLRKAAKLDAKDPILDRKLAALMVKRGKEMLDKGDSQSGLAYLQEARSYDPRSVVPTVTLRNASVSVGPATHTPELLAEVWNPGPNPILSLTAKVELFDTSASRVLWDTDRRIIDEFEPPLPANESRPFSVTAPVTVRANGQTEFRIYFGGALYRSYPIGSKSAAGAASGDKESPGGQGGEPEPGSAGKAEGQDGKIPPVAPNVVPKEPAPVEAPPLVAPKASPQAKPPEAQPLEKPPAVEDKTLKDLEL